MNNKELLAALAKKTNMTSDQVSEFINDFNQAVTQVLEKNDTIMISNFGTFEVRKKLEKITFNPATKERVITPPKLAVAFKASDTLKDRFRNNIDEE